MQFGEVNFSRDRERGQLPESVKLETTIFVVDFFKRHSLIYKIFIFTELQAPPTLRHVTENFRISFHFRVIISTSPKTCQAKNMEMCHDNERSDKPMEH
jgi:hypothetical protein